MEQHPSYYTNIPAFVRYDEELLRKPKSILLYGEIVALSNQKGYCWASNSYFAERLRVSGRMIQDYLDILVTKGYVARKLIYKPHSKQVDKRILSIASRPGEADFMRGDEMDFTRPGEADFAENITSINNTSTNNTSAGTQSASSENPFDLIHEYHINANEGDHLSVFLNAIDQLGAPLVCWAIHQTVDGPAPHSWSYLKKVFNRLKTDNISSVEEANKRAEEHKRGKNSGSVPKSRKKRIYD
ncbi:helix-turn-helix domain-containing protein [Limosilactobacillus agrestis]|uniref:helix-turn-helix domain-containing protein n=1 Tax=Limosilactobacillus agrestis TaxID=2759748 RepID=UPI001E2F0BB7|nr:helix-turn-helix domain-containing protein [Limosilactobacillus agrestis]MCD7113459.1 helix-turn-helix domain-containing protein [Limosilactobacillus agrestis]